MRRWIKRLIAPLALLSVAVPARAESPFIIFFDSGSVHLDQADSAILDNAVAVIRNFDVRSIEISGHADRVGSDRDNVELSRRRAEAVRAALLARGMSRRIEVTIVAQGESQPLVETGDGVSHAENRYVTIMLVGRCVNLDNTRFDTPDCRTQLPD
ncbi:MAG TPA: OmpA family protein [Allosphingosinicella sp.]|nr:OmpA family protein [Allosphingosinicella sp.]